ncbi:hypothetical protein [Merismopedia glauca]|uniref:Uncharacterized protein n=1 Tax=Merismopedia glauca CCAP 1448/3 TaxID=1296344 RepID=A0A2T1C1U4_9CYAN|nr:hypothetical protein [Merismopedia glauca]PSB02212.1 hypothetical protein C7B64_14380 [Merismopedia glauca CCAP 1448/3]
MATILINDLNPAGYSLFTDDESYLRDLSSDDELSISGGATTSVTWTIASSGWCVATIVTISLVDITRRLL